MHEPDAGDADDDDEDDAEEEEAASRSTLSGASVEQEDSGRQLLQLVQRKWNRVYAVKFYRLMISRILLMAYTWGAIVIRAGYASAGTQFNLFCDAPNNTDSSIDTVGSCATVRVLTIVLTIGSLLMLLHHGARLVLLGGPSLWRALRRERHSHVRKPLSLTHQAAAYVAGHSGGFGKFYVTTLLLACGLIGIGGLVDLSYGWSSAVILYAIGGFFAGSHMVYFLLGFGTTGPLVVMLAVALPTFWRCVVTPDPCIRRHATVSLAVGCSSMCRVWRSFPFLCLSFFKWVNYCERTDPRIVNAFHFVA